MNQNTRLARELALSTAFDYPEILCQIEKLETRKFPFETVDKIIREAMNMSRDSQYSLAEAVDKMTAPFSRFTRHVPVLQQLKN